MTQTEPAQVPEPDPFTTEVLALHRFLDAWLKGEIDRGDDVPARLAEALADDFKIIHPDGTRGDRNSAIEGFAGAFGEKPPEYALLISDIEVRDLAPGLCLATYVERHRGELRRARSTSVLLRRRDDGKIEWLRLQETPAPKLDDPPA